MDVLSRTRRHLKPVVGGMTVVATATGALAGVSQMAPVLADPGDASAALGADALAGALQGCEAYFGFGKPAEGEDGLGVFGIVAFDVEDTNGADGVAHAVDVDTDVVLVLENEEGDELECIPYEITEAMWDDEFDGEGEVAFPAWPGAGHYAYPSTSLFPTIDEGEFGEVVAAGFRVTTVPGQHTLVSPTGVKALDPIFYPFEDLIDGIPDPDVLAYVVAEEGSEGADAFADAVAACGEDDETELPQSGPLAGAVEQLAELVGVDEPAEIDCDVIEELHFFSSIVLGFERAVAYTEVIQLSVPAAPAEPPAAQPAQETPAFTG